jgi:hypothetical protein
MANAVMPFKSLRNGVDEVLYTGPGGAVNTTGAMGTFGLPPQASIYRGVLVLQAVPVGGTVTAIAFQLELGMFPQGMTQAPFQIFNKLVVATPQTLCAYSGISLLAPVALDISSLGGEGQLRLNFTTVTLGTGTGFDVYAHIG